MIRDLLLVLKNAGYEAIILDGGIVVTIGHVTIGIGKDEDSETLMTYVQEDLEAGPSHLASENMTPAEVLALCEQYRQQPIASTPVVVTPSPAAV